MQLGPAIAAVTITGGLAFLYFGGRKSIEALVSGAPHPPLPLPMKVNSKYGSRKLLGLTFHYGVDLQAGMSTPLYAMQSGTVIMAKLHGNDGNEVQIQTKGGRIWSYHHLNAFQVSEGQTVIRGQVIGYSGNTGLSTGPHLHLGLKLSPGGNWVDPMAYMPSSWFA